MEVDHLEQVVVQEVEEEVQPLQVVHTELQAVEIVLEDKDQEVQIAEVDLLEEEVLDKEVLIQQAPPMEHLQQVGGEAEHQEADKEIEVLMEDHVAELVELGDLEEVVVDPEGGELRVPVDLMEHQEEEVDQVVDLEAEEGHLPPVDHMELLVVEEEAVEDLAVEVALVNIKEGGAERHLTKK